MSRRNFLALAFSFMVVSPLTACSGGDDSGSGGGSTTSSSSSCASASEQAYACINDRCACTGSKEYTLTKEEAEKRCAKSSGNCPAPSTSGTATGTAGGSSTPPPTKTATPPADGEDED